MDAIELLKKYIDFLENKLYLEGYDWHDVRDCRYEFMLELNDNRK